MAAGVGVAVFDKECNHQAYASNYSTTFGYSQQGTGSGKTWSLTNCTDQSSFWQCPTGTGVTTSVALFPGVFTNKTITSNVTITINNATYGSGTNPSESTFKIYNSSACTSQVTASGSTFASSSTYVNTVYTVTTANAASFTNDLAIKITKPGRTIRLKSVTIAFSYSGGSTTTYTVTYDNNGGTGTMTDSNSPYTAGATVTVMDNEFTRDNYTFDHWNTAADDSGTDYDEGAKFTINANTTLYAQWEASSSSEWNDATMTAGTNGSTCTVNLHDGIKVGTSSKGGDMTITVPAGAKRLKVYAAAWNGVTGLSLNITPTANISPTVISLTANSGIANSSPFTLSSGSDEEDYKFEFTLTNISSATTFTFATSTTKRFALWNAQYSTQEGGTPGKLGTPSPVFDRSNNTITWSAVTNATSYELKLDSGSYSAETSGYSVAGVSINDSHTVSVIAKADGYTTSDEGTVTFHRYATKGTQSDPYTVADARRAITNNDGTDNVYAKGIVSSIVSDWSSQYNNISFNFVDTKGDTDFLEAYRCASGNADASGVLVGDDVVVYGSLILHSSTYEFGEGCTLESLTHPVTPYLTINSGDSKLAAQGVAKTISGSISNNNNYTITWTCNNNAVTFSSSTSTHEGQITVTAASSIAVGTEITITGTLDDEDETSQSVIFVVSSKTADSVANAITASEANTLVLTGHIEGTPLYVKGYVTKCESNKQMFFIDDQKGTTETFEVYNSSGTISESTQKDAYVVVHGTAHKYNSVAETTGSVVDSSDYFSITSNLLEVQQGSTATITVSSATGTVAWSKTAGTGDVSLTSTSDSGATVSGVSQGTATITIAVGNYVEVVSVTVTPPPATVTGLSVYDDKIDDYLTDNDEIELDASSTSSVSDDIMCEVSYSDSTTGYEATIISSPTSNFSVSFDNDIYTLTFSANGDYEVTISAGNFSLTVTYSVAGITAPSVIYYEKVTENLSDWSGTYLIVDETSGNIMDGSVTTGSGAIQSATISEGKIESTSTIDSYSFTIEKGTVDSSLYTVCSASGYYMDRISGTSGGRLDWSNSVAYELSIVYVTDHTEIRATTYSSSNKQTLQYNNSSSIFKFYASAQRTIQLYKKGSGENKPLEGLSFEEGVSDTCYVGSTYTLTLSFNPSDASNKSVTWNSSNTSVATVAQTSTKIGTVTTLDTGSTTITATSAEDSSIIATFALTVVDRPTYTLVTSQDDLYEGAKVIIYANGYAMGDYNSEASTKHFYEAEATVENNTLTNVGGHELTVEMYGDAIAFKYDNSSYLNYTGSANTLSTTSTLGADASWKMDSNGIYNAATTNRYIRDNHTNTRFACYDANAATQTGVNVSIYIASTTPTTEQQALTFLYRELHLRDVVPTDDHVDTNACRESGSNAKNYYNIAKSVWNSNDFASARSLILNGSGDYALGLARLRAWALANSEDLNQSNILEQRKYISLLNFANKNTNTVAIIVIVSMVSVTAIGGYFFLRRRKENI